MSEKAESGQVKSSHSDLTAYPDPESEDLSISHSDLVSLSSRVLNKLLSEDPLICDLPKDVTPQEVLAQAAVAGGSALTVEVMRGDGETVSAVVQRAGATLWQLRRALQRALELRERRRQAGRTLSISWKHVWKAYALQVVSGGGEQLTRRHDGETLQNLGIGHRSKLVFVRRRRDKLRPI